MTDAGARRHHLEVVERSLGPAQQLVALDVALVLDLHVVGEGARCATALGDDRVVDDQLDRHQGVDAIRVAAQGDDGVAHGGEVDHAGDAREVLHQHPFGGEGDLMGRLGGGAAGLGQPGPAGDGLDVGGMDLVPVLVAQQVLEQHLDAVGQPGHVVGVEARGVEAEDLEGATADVEGGAGLEGIGVWRGGTLGHGRHSARVGAGAISGAEPACPWCPD